MRAIPTVIQVCKGSATPSSFSRRGGGLSKGGPSIIAVRRALRCRRHNSSTLATANGFGTDFNFSKLDGDLHAGLRTMAKGAFKVGDEVMVRATVAAVWKDGHITIHINSVGQKITLPNEPIVVADSEPARPKRKGERLL